MEGGSWTGIVDKAARAHFEAFGSAEAARAAWLPWEELSDAVKAFLKVEALGALDGTEVYRRVVGLFESRPRVRGRFKSLLAWHDGERLKEALIRLVSTREGGDPGRRIDALGLGGVGRATASEIMCLWWPYRFLPQNAATCEKMAKLTELYRKRDLAEMPYDIFMQFAGTFESAFRAQGGAVWPELAPKLNERRFLYFYIFLTDL